MGDIDLFGILSLLLAAGGAAYILRSRFASRPAATAEVMEPNDPRQAVTEPPKLRPQTRPPPRRLADSSPDHVPASSAEPPSTKPAPAAAPPKSDPKAKSEPKAAPKSEPKAAPKSEPKAAPKSEPKPAPKSEPAVGRLEDEEDPDVEATKVGKPVPRKEIQPPVDKIVFDEGADAEAPEHDTPMMVVYALAQSDPGRRRKQNEDNYLVLKDEGIFVVADGMGGHHGGEIASKLAVDTIQSAFESGHFEAKAHPGIPAAASELARAIQMANAAILEESKRQPKLKGMGTTICSIRFAAKAERLYVGHVGDSRCYRLRDGALKQVSTDHTMASHGVTGPEAAHLSRAVGVWPTVPIDVLCLMPKLGDSYLLCSDGLTKMLPDNTIATQLLHEEDPKVAVERLVMFANSHGGKDNITVILIRVVEPGWTPPKSPSSSSTPLPQAAAPSGEASG